MSNERKIEKLKRVIEDFIKERDRLQVVIDLLEKETRTKSITRQSGKNESDLLICRTKINSINKEIEHKRNRLYSLLNPREELSKNSLTSVEMVFPRTPSSKADDQPTDIIANVSEKADVPISMPALVTTEQNPVMSLSTADNSIEQITVQNSESETVHLIQSNSTPIMSTGNFRFDFGTNQAKTLDPSISTLQDSPYYVPLFSADGVPIRTNPYVRPSKLQLPRQVKLQSDNMKKPTAEKSVIEMFEKTGKRKKVAFNDNNQDQIVPQMNSETGFKIVPNDSVEIRHTQLSNQIKENIMPQNVHFPYPQNKESRKRYDFVASENMIFRTENNQSRSDESITSEMEYANNALIPLDNATNAQFQNLFHGKPAGNPYFPAQIIQREAVHYQNPVNNQIPTNKTSNHTSEAAFINSNLTDHHYNSNSNNRHNNPNSTYTIPRQPPNFSGNVQTPKQTTTASNSAQYHTNQSFNEMHKMTQNSNAFPNSNISIPTQHSNTFNAHSNPQFLHVDDPQIQVNPQTAYQNAGQNRNYVISNQSQTGNAMYPQPQRPIMSFNQSAPISQIEQNNNNRFANTMGPRNTFLKRLNNIPEFDGESFENMKKFLEKTQTLYNSCINTDELNELYEQILIKVTGEARDIVQAQHTFNWENTKMRLLEHFSHLCNKSLLTTQLENLKQNPNESLIDYADRARKMLKMKNAMYTFLNDDQKKEHERTAYRAFYKGLNNLDLKNRVETRGASSLENAIESVIDMEKDSINLIPNHELYCRICKVNGHREQSCRKNDNTILSLVEALRNIGPVNFNRNQNMAQNQYPTRYPNLQQSNRYQYRQYERRPNTYGNNDYRNQYSNNRPNQYLYNERPNNYNPNTFVPNYNRQNNNNQNNNAISRYPRNNSQINQNNNAPQNYNNPQQYNNRINRIRIESEKDQYSNSGEN